VKSLLKERERVLAALRDTCKVLQDIECDHTEYLQAYLDESKIEPTISAQAQTKMEELEAIRKEEALIQGVDLKDIEALEEVWPLKKIWIQVLFYKLRNVVLGGDDRVISKVIEEQMRMQNKEVSTFWLRSWLCRHYGQGGQSGSLTSAKWCYWRQTLLRHKLQLMAYFRENYEWLMRMVVSPEIHTANFKLRLGNWGHKVNPENSTFSIRTDDTGPSLLQEFGARTISPRPQCCVGIDIKLGVPSPPSEDEDVDDESDDGAIDFEYILEQIEDFIDIVLENELEQIPGYICTKANLYSAERLIRIVVFFHKGLPNNWWIQKLDATITFWPPMEAFQDWFLSEYLSFSGVYVDMSLDYRHNDSPLFGFGTTLNLGPLAEIENPLNKIYNSCMNETGVNRTQLQTDEVVKSLLELASVGYFEAFSAIRIVNGQQAMTVEKAKQK